MLSLCVVVALSAPGGASALGEPPPYTQLRTSGTSSSLWAQFKSLLRGNGTISTQYGTLMGGESSTTAAGMESQLARARVAARFLPRLGLVASRVSLVGTAAYIGWKIYQHYSDGSTVTLDLFLDSAVLGKDALANGQTVPSNLGGVTAAGYFVWNDAALMKLSGSECSSNVGESDCFGVELRPFYCSQGTGNACSTFWSQEWMDYQDGMAVDGHQAKEWRSILDWDDCSAAAVVTSCVGAGHAIQRQGVQWLATRTMENLQGKAKIAGATVYPVTIPRTIGTAVIPNRRVYLKASELGLGLAVTQRGTLPGTPDISTDYNVPSDAGDTSADATAALDALDTVCGRSLVNYLLSDGVYPWPAGCIENQPATEPDPVTFTLPRPQANETYADYVQRLRDAGWLGAATEVVLDPVDSSIGTSAVSKIGVTGRTGTWRRALWPTSNPVLAPSVDLTFWHNPDTAPPVAPDPTDEENPDGGGGVVDPGTGSSDCSCPPIDFGPLSGVGTTTKFPFGVFSWVQDVFSGFSGSVAPSETLTTPIGPVTIDLAGSSGNVATVRSYTDPVFKFFVVLGSVWWLATSIIGLGRGGIEHGD